MKKVLTLAVAISSLAVPAMAMGCFDNDFKTAFMRAINGQKYLPTEVIVEVAAVHAAVKPIGAELVCSAIIVTASGDPRWVVIHALADSYGTYKWWTTKWDSRVAY